MKSVQEDLRIAFPKEDSFGFAGAIQTNSYREETGANAVTAESARRLWDRACAAVRTVFGETDPEVIENFLRGTCGRHLADATYNEARGKRDEASLSEAIATALGRKVRVHSRLGGYVEKLAWEKWFEESRRATLSDR